MNFTFFKKSNLNAKEIKILENEISIIEKTLRGTTKTNNSFFNENGYLLLKNLCSVENLLCNVPKERGRLLYQNKNDYIHLPTDDHVDGSVSRYNYPKYKEIHSKIRLILEDIIGKKLYNTYYFDRFYFPGQELTKHLDRDSCEISVSVHVGTNLKKKWPFYVKTPDTYCKDTSIKKGSDVDFYLNPGDAVLYMGCERPHWRKKLPGRKRNIIRKIFKQKELYYHQIFFHYVLADGERSHYAFDRVPK